MPNQLSQVEKDHNNFPYGIIPNRVAEYLSALPASRILAAVEDGLIVDGEQPGDALSGHITPYNLMWDKLDEYAALADVPLYKFLYGEMPSDTRYSFFDREVTALLDVVPADLLPAINKVVASTYVNDKFQITHAFTPSAKLITLLLLGKKLPEKVPESEMHFYQTDINMLLTRLHSYGKKEHTVFHIDYILDLCTFCRVSPHWVFSLRGPLFCQTPGADAFFDIFCLLSKSQQISVLAMLLALCPDAEHLLSSEDLNLIHQAISCEGGIV